MSVSAGWPKYREMGEDERLARAVLLFYRGGQWSDADQKEWRELTGDDAATTKTLATLAWAILKPTYRCNRCGALSFHPADIRNRYCGRCHQYQRDPGEPG